MAALLRQVATPLAGDRPSNAKVTESTSWKCSPLACTCSKPDKEHQTACTNEPARSALITAQPRLGWELLTAQDVGTEHKSQGSTRTVVCTCAQLSAAPGLRSFKESITSVNRLYTPSCCVQQHGLGLPEGLPENGTPVRLHLADLHHCGGLLEVIS